MDGYTKYVDTTSDNKSENEGNNNNLLPVEIIKRVIKNSFPDKINCKLTKEAKDAFQEILSEFIGFITSEAAEKAASDNRKTIYGTDILQAMDDLGFDAYSDLLSSYHQKVKFHNDSIVQESINKRKNE